MDLFEPYLVLSIMFKTSPDFARRKEPGKNSSTKFLHLPLAISQGVYLEYFIIPAHIPQAKAKEKQRQFAGRFPRMPYHFM